MITAIFQYRFLQNALMAGMIASILCGIIGVIIIEKKLIMMSGGIAHTSYGGVGLGYLLGFSPIVGAFIFSVCAALGAGFIKRKGRTDFDVIMGLFWSFGMALGILFIALMPGYPPDLTTYLFGNILSVTYADLRLAAFFAVIVVAAVVIYFNDWKAYLFDDEFAFIKGVKTVFLEYLLLVLVAMTVVALIRVVGIVLAIALLTAPAATAAIFTSNLKRRMIYAVVLGNVFCFFGLWISDAAGAPSGAVIVALSVCVYLTAYGVRALVLKRKQAPRGAGTLNRQKRSGKQSLR